MGSNIPSVSTGKGKIGLKTEDERAAYEAIYARIDQKIMELHVGINYINRDIYRIVEDFDAEWRVVSKDIEEKKAKIEKRAVDDYLKLKKRVDNFLENLRMGNIKALEKFQKVEKVVLNTMTAE